MYQLIHCGMVSIVAKLERLAVACFLREFKAFAAKNGLGIFERRNYMQTLAGLGILPNDAKEIILDLTPENYYKGLGAGTRENEQICEFGTWVGEDEIYIKLLMDTGDERAFCFSFHKAERAIAYPFADTVG